jgi:predicted DNA-binding protein YlxM (UPF0122 family)
MTELQEILKIIQFQTDLSLTEIADKVDYARETVSRVYSSGESSKLLRLLKKDFKTEIFAFRTKYPNSAREQPSSHEKNTQVQLFLEAIKKSVIQIEAALTPPDVPKSDIEEIQKQTGAKIGKGKPVGKHK